MTWLRSVQPSADGEAASFDDVFALRPELHESYRAFYALFWEQGLVDPRLLEIARLRIAALNGAIGETQLRYRPALDAGFSERHAGAAIAGRPYEPDGDELRDPGDTHDTSDERIARLETACLVVAEKFVLDVHSIVDEDIRVLREGLGEPALVALIEAMALFDGFTRFRSALGVDRGSVVGLPITVEAPSFVGERS